MSKFLDKKVFMIIDKDEITVKMVNLSTSMSKENMPSKISGGITKCILETTDPADAVFENYEWHDKNTIVSAWGAIVED